MVKGYRQECIRGMVWYGTKFWLGPKQRLRFVWKSVWFVFCFCFKLDVIYYREGIVRMSKISLLRKHRTNVGGLNIEIRWERNRLLQLSAQHTHRLGGEGVWAGVLEEAGKGDFFPLTKIQLLSCVSAKIKFIHTSLHLESINSSCLKLTRLWQLFVFASCENGQNLIWACICQRIKRKFWSHYKITKPNVM
jgi:hypothetical protein